MMKTVSRLCVALLLSLVAGVANAGERPLTVVELYTSQGCSSCPPADAYLGELAKQADILALSLHVDYWDYIGWKDPYAIPASTARQRVYARNLGMGYVYTPQMVVQGMAHATGSDRGAVSKLIRDLADTKHLDVKIAHVTDGLKIDIPGGLFDDEAARVVVAVYDSRLANDVQRGENAGITLSHYNVVRAVADVGAWSGDAVSLSITDKDIEMSGHGGCAVLVQSTRNGRILGAAKIALMPQG